MVSKFFIFLPVIVDLSQVVVFASALTGIDTTTARVSEFVTFLRAAISMFSPFYLFLQTFAIGALKKSTRLKPRVNINAHQVKSGSSLQLVGL